MKNLFKKIKNKLLKRGLSDDESDEKIKDLFEKLSKEITNSKGGKVTVFVQIQITGEVTVKEKRKGEKYNEQIVETTLLGIETTRICEF